MGKLKPGQIAPKSGQYAIVGSNGRVTEVERTIVTGEPLPPTPKPGQTYVIVDRTKH